MTARRHNERYFAGRALIAIGVQVGIALVLLSGVINCPLAAIFHVPCPACGSTRAARAILAFDAVGALRANPVAPLAVALFFALGVRAVWLVFRDGSLRALGEGPVARLLVRLLLIAVALEIIVWAARFFGFLGGPVPV